MMREQHPEGDGAAPIREPAAPRDDADDLTTPAGTDRDAPIVVEVTRTGGFAGTVRTWRAEAAESQREQWLELIGQCPWNATEIGAGRGADRFVWDIRAGTPDAELSAAVADTALTGPWRVLVDHVRAVAGT